MREIFKSAARTYLGRVCALFLGVPIGWILCIGGIVALFWNEGRAVKTERTLQEGMASVVTIGAAEMNPALTGRLVHVQGCVSTQEILRDPIFEVSAQVPRLKRLVETFQWRERSRNVSERTASGGQRRRVSYEYEEVWAPGRFDSSKFNQPFGHENPPAAPFPCAEWEAKEFHLGAFTLQKALRDELRGFEPYGIRVSDPPANVRQLGFRALIASFYMGNDPMSPQVGDVRVVYEAVAPMDVSIIGSQDGAMLGSYRTKSGGTIAMVSHGTKSATEMFQDGLLWNRIVTWLWRVGGFFALWHGYGLALRPLTVVASMLPGLVGGLTLATGFFASLFLALALTSITTSIAWLFYRPQFGLPMLAGGVLVLTLLGRWGNRKRRLAIAFASE